MAKVERFEDLEPIKSDFGLKDQIRRAAMSLSDSVAEGFEYNNNPDFIRFLVYAKGSSGELRNKLIILMECGKLSHEDFDNLYVKSIEFSSKTKSFISYLKTFENQKKLNAKK